MFDLKAKAYSRRAPSGEAPAGSSSRAAWMTFFSLRLLGYSCAILPVMFSSLGTLMNNEGPNNTNSAVRMI
jgi:hypothetical protein